MATTKKKTTAVATKSPAGELVPYDYGEDAGVGMDITMDDLKIPFISLVQNDSKVLDEDEDTYVSGGKAGMLFNGATQEFSDSLLLVPAIRRTTYVEWLPDRGGFVEEHDQNSAVVADAKRNAVTKYELRTESGNELIETRSIFAIILSDDLEPLGYCVVPFTSSKMAPWRDYWTAIDTARVSKKAPVFSLLVRLSAKDAKSKVGKKFKNFVMLPARDEKGTLTLDQNKTNVAGSMLAPTEGAYLAARELRDAVDSGRASADRETAVGETGKEDTDVVF